MGDQKEKQKLKRSGRPKWCGRSARKVEAKEWRLEKFDGDKDAGEAEKVVRPN